MPKTMTKENHRKFAVCQVLSLDMLQDAISPVGILTITLDYMLAKISPAIGFEVAPDRVNLFIRPYPYDSSERGGHYDKLKPRTCLELEMVTVKY